MDIVSKSKEAQKNVVGSGSPAVPSRLSSTEQRSDPRPHSTTPKTQRPNGTAKRPASTGFAPSPVRYACRTKPGQNARRNSSQASAPFQTKRKSLSKPWAVTQLPDGGSDDDDDDDEAQDTAPQIHKDNLRRGSRIPTKDEDEFEEVKEAPKPRRMAKSEQHFEKQLNDWLSKDDVGSDEYDTELEDHFPEEEKIVSDNTGVQEYLLHCERRKITPVAFLIRNLGEGNLRMRHHYLGGRATVPLAKALEENTVTEEIDLSDNYIEGQGAKSLAGVMKNNMFIVNLNISNNFVRSQGAEAFGEMLETNITLKTLSLKGNHITDRDAEKIGEALKNNLSLNTLDLSYNEIGESGGTHIAGGLAVNVALADLDLSWNSISRLGGAAIAKALTKNKMLEILDLSWNGLSDVGAEALGTALRSNKSLRVLDLTNNRIGPEGAKKLSAGIAKNTGLETILLAMNPIDPDSLEALVKAVASNTRLKLVDFQDIQTTPAIDARIEELCANRDIMIVTSAGTPQSNRINPTILTVFERFIQENAHRLEDLFLQMDKDKSGDITLEEFKFGLKDFGIRLTSKQLDTLLEELDADKSGSIELNELLAGTEIIEQENLKKAVREKEQQLLRDSIQAAVAANTDESQSDTHTDETS